MKEPILLAEPEPSLRRAYFDALADDFEVFVAVSGAEALSLLRIVTPTALVAALEMPELDGLQLVAQARAVPRLGGLPAALLVANGGAERVTGAGLSRVAAISAGRPGMLAAELIAFLTDVRARRLNHGRSH